MPQTELADRLELMRGERRPKAGRAAALEEHVDVFGRPRVAVVNDGDPADQLEPHARVFEQRPDGTKGHVDLRQIGVHGASEAAEAGDRVRGGIHGQQNSTEGRGGGRAGSEGRVRARPEGGRLPESKAVGSARPMVAPRLRAPRPGPQGRDAQTPHGR